MARLLHTPAFMFRHFPRSTLLLALLGPACAPTANVPMGLLRLPEGTSGALAWRVGDQTYFGFDRDGARSTDCEDGQPVTELIAEGQREEEFAWLRFPPDLTPGRHRAGELRLMPLLTSAPVGAGGRLEIEVLGRASSGVWGRFEAELCDALDADCAAPVEVSGAFSARPPLGGSCPDDR